MTNDQSLQGKTALITGASRGIGRQIALELGRRGCTVILHSRTISHTANLTSELQQKGTQAYQIDAELSDTAAVQSLYQRIVDKWGHIDILYNNAAIMTPYHDDIFITNGDEYLLSFKVNTIAPITLCNLFLPDMIKRNYGRIVNITSGIKDQPQLMAYAASKAALDKYVYDMAPHLKGTGVTMNLVDPGWLRTDLGGPNAPNAVESVIPGAIVPILKSDDICGKWFSAQDYAGQIL
ncbi:MAG: SDR family NAD(P)-dependent oxidoreductase [Fibrobacterota bacterium]|nr:SDR family oxidoreductase [Chitinispirillaceae bacterium]